MSFIWPAMLALLVLLPVGVALNLRIRQKRVARLAGYGSLGSGAAQRAAGAGHLRMRRRISGTFILLGLAVMVVALARPQAVVSVPSLEGTVILAFDVSGSMAATDLIPTRMEAAKAAALDFVERQPTSVQIGVVAFSDGGLSVQAPSNDQTEVIAAINRLVPTRGTSVGQGILASLKIIAAQEEGVDYYTNRSPSTSPSPSPTPVPDGTYDSAAIVLLSDGENNQSPDPLEAAQLSADRGVRIYTVGIGSTAGVNLEVNGFRVHTQLNEPELMQISDMTDGTYWRAENAQELRTIYDNLDTELVVKPQAMEVTSVFAGASLLLLLIGAVFSLVWLRRVP
jgi:Ca-activated chloride channel family protein